MDGSKICEINGYGSTTDVRSLGNYWGGSQEWGTLDSVAIYDRALTEEEIKEHSSL